MKKKEKVALSFTCQHCGGEVSAQDEFCTHCGKRFLNEIKCPFCGYSDISSKFIDGCPNCNREFKDWGKVNTLNKTSTMNFYKTASIVMATISILTVIIVAIITTL